MNREAQAMRAAARVMRARNGRLAVDWITRTQKPRWHMLPLDSTWYDRGRLRALVAARAGGVGAGGAGAVVPSTSRPLTRRELAAIANTNPWSLHNKKR